MAARVDEATSGEEVQTTIDATAKARERWYGARPHQVRVAGRTRCGVCGGCASILDRLHPLSAIARDARETRNLASRRPHSPCTVGPTPTPHPPAAMASSYDRAITVFSPGQTTDTTDGRAAMRLSAEVKISSSQRASRKPRERMEGGPTEHQWTHAAVAFQLACGACLRRRCVLAMGVRLFC